jgi:NAD(P)-dependent dehydrogenase (short-subunit alcohol dehydrogenase family)
MALTGKGAVVAGAASGIGLGLAHELAAAGCRLSLANIDADALHLAGKSRDAEGFDVMTSLTDVGHLPDVERLAEQTLARFGATHIVINNAGVIAWNPAFLPA